jgi:hypothetical protein
MKLTIKVARGPALTLSADLFISLTESSAAKKARDQEPIPSANGNAKHQARFLGTTNPRYLRILHALMQRARTREEIDRIAGASNGPDAIAALRALGLTKKEHLRCDRVPALDRDGIEVMRGVYYLTEAGRRCITAWMVRRDKGALN